MIFLIITFTVISMYMIFAEDTSLKGLFSTKRSGSMNYFTCRNYDTMHETSSKTVKEHYASLAQQMEQQRLRSQLRSINEHEQYVYKDDSASMEDIVAPKLKIDLRKRKR